MLPLLFVTAVLMRRTGWVPDTRMHLLLLVGVVGKSGSSSHGKKRWPSLPQLACPPLEHQLRGWCAACALVKPSWPKSPWLIGGKGEGEGGGDGGDGGGGGGGAGGGEGGLGGWRQMAPL